MRAVMASLVVVVVASFTLPAAAAAAPSPGDQTKPIRGGDAAAGASVYTTYCTACHGPHGEGVIGPTLAAAAFPGLVAPKVRVGGHGMPAFAGRISEADIINVSVYVAQRLAAPAARLASVAQGGVIYRLYCSGCHNAAGRGGALIGGLNAPSLQGMPAGNVLAGVVRGPANMPVFTGTLDVTQQASVARYAQTALVQPPHPGGWPLDFIGPVAEGVASFVALAVIIFIAVWLAWRRGGGADAA